ncbi:MAG: hypothetical protein ACM3NF_04725 [Gemmatimonadota bacterium]
MIARSLLLAAFGAAMAFAEAAVVVDLRAVIGAGPLFPMKDLPPPLLSVEIGREVATIVMLLSVALLSVRGAARRMGAFLLLFAAWDAFYYLWLRIATGWPGGLADWDILFLIPLPWVGPVWSVLVICAGMAAFAVLFLGMPEEASFSPGLWGWVCGVVGTAVVVATYILEWAKIDYGRGVPSDFSVGSWLAGIALLGAAGSVAVRSTRSVWRRDRLL